MVETEKGWLSDCTPHLQLQTEEASSMGLHLPDFNITGRFFLAFIIFDTCLRWLGKLSGLAVNLIPIKFLGSDIVRYLEFHSFSLPL